MKENIEKFISDGSEIIELKEGYLGESVKAFLINKDNTLTQISVTEIGNKYISLTEEESKIKIKEKDHFSFKNSSTLKITIPKNYSFNM